MPNFKKIVSAICAAAILITSAVVPVMAATGDTYYQENFDSFTSGNLVTAEPDKNTNTDYVAEGFSFHCGSRAGGDWDRIGIKVGSDAQSGNAIYMWASKNNDKNARMPYIELTNMTDKTFESAMYVSFDAKLNNDATGIVLYDGTNSVKFNTSISDAVTAGNWYNYVLVSYVNDGNYTITISDADGNVVDSINATGALTNVTRINTDGSSQVDHSIDNLVIKDVEVPLITVEEGDKIRVGETLKIANVQNADSVMVTLSNDTDFDYTVDADGNIMLTALDTVASNTTVDVTIEAVGGVNVSRTLTYTALTSQDLVDGVVANLDISGSAITKNGDKYTVIGGFTVLTTEDSADITWTADDSAVTISADGNVAVDTTVGKEIILTATVSYNGATASKTFTLVIPSNKIFYDENFDNVATGNIATIDGPGTGEVNGIEAHVPERGGSNNAIYISVDENASISSSKYLTFHTGNYNVSDKGANNTRQSYVVFTRMEDLKINNTLRITFDLYCHKDTCSLIFTDGKSDLTIGATAQGLELNKWYNINIDTDTKSGVSTLTVKDENGIVVNRYNPGDVLTSLTQIKTNGGNDIDFHLDNLKIMDAVVPTVTLETDTVLAGETEAVAAVENAETVNLTLSDSSNFEANYADGKVMVTSKATSATQTQLTVEATSEGVVTKEVFEIFTKIPSQMVDASKAQNIINYAADEKGKVVTLAAADGVTVYGDLILPATETVSVDGKDYTVDLAWEITSGSATMKNDGTISVTDKTAKPVTIKKNISYVKNGVVKASDSVEYDVNVQFDPDTVKQTVTDLVNAKNSTITNEEDKYNLENYLCAFVYNMQVKLDKALASNFSAIPTSVSSNTSFTLPAVGYFGSAFAWYSSNSSVIQINTVGQNITATVKQPSNSTAVNLTAYVTAGIADKADYLASVSVSGSGSSSGGGNGGGGGGSTRPSTGSSIAGDNVAPVTPSKPSNVVLNPNPSGFTDLGSVSWAVTAINNLYVNNIVEGKTATEFYPNDNITRAEFATILVKAFKIPFVSVNSAKFYDVSTSHWASKYVETAAAAGIVEGYDDGSFEPNTKVTRQDMAIMVKRAAEATGFVFTEKVEATSFTDEATIAAYAKDAISVLQKAGVVNGVEGGAFAPLATSTRAQACQIIYNVFNK